MTQFAFTNFPCKFDACVHTFYAIVVAARNQMGFFFRANSNWHLRKGNNVFMHFLLLKTIHISLNEFFHFKRKILFQKSV